MVSTCIHGLGIHDPASLTFPFTLCTPAVDCLLTAFNSALSDGDLYQRSLTVEPRGGRKPAAPATLVSPPTSPRGEPTTAATVPTSATATPPASPSIKPPTADELESERRSVARDAQLKSSLYDRFAIKIEETKKALAEMRHKVELEDNDDERMRLLQALQEKEIYLLALKSDYATMAPNRPPPQPPPRTRGGTSGTGAPTSQLTNLSSSSATDLQSACTSLTPSPSESPASPATLNISIDDLGDGGGWESFEYNNVDGAGDGDGNDDEDGSADATLSGDAEDEVLAHLAATGALDDADASAAILQNQPIISLRHQYRSPSVHSYESQPRPPARRPPPRRMTTTTKSTNVSIVTLPAPGTGDAASSASASASASASPPPSASPSLGPEATPTLNEPEGDLSLARSRDDDTDDAPPTRQVPRPPPRRAKGAVLPTASPFAPRLFRGGGGAGEGGAGGGGGVVSQ